MTHLLLVLELSAMSKLLSARSKPPSTPLGSYPNVLKSLSQKNLKKYLPTPLLLGKILFVRALDQQNFINKRLDSRFFNIFLRSDFRFMKMLPQRGDGWDGSDK